MNSSSLSVSAVVERVDRVEDFVETGDDVNENRFIDCRRLGSSEDLPIASFRKVVEVFNDRRLDKFLPPPPPRRRLSLLG